MGRRQRLGHGQLRLGHALPHQVLRGQQHDGKGNGEPRHGPGDSPLASQAEHQGKAQGEQQGSQDAHGQTQPFMGLVDEREDGTDLHGIAWKIDAFAHHARAGLNQC